jgi:hypothetical protein
MCVLCPCTFQQLHSLTYTIWLTIKLTTVCRPVLACFWYVAPLTLSATTIVAVVKAVSCRTFSENLCRTAKKTCFASMFYIQNAPQITAITNMCVVVSLWMKFGTRLVKMLSDCWKNNGLPSKKKIPKKSQQKNMSGNEILQTSTSSTSCVA